jgi:hypothetical protein
MGKEDLNQRLAKQQEAPAITIQGFAGLSLKLDYVNRANNTWQQLDNFDLYIPGSIRKTTPPVLYGGPYGANILNATEYQAQPNNPNGGILRNIGVGADGKLYDLASATPATPYLDTSSLLGTPISIPQMYQVSGYYVPFNIKSWVASTAYSQYDAVLQYSPTDGQIYVFYCSTAGTSGAHEPIWPNTGAVTDNTAHWTNAGIPNSQRFFANYLVIVTPGKQPIRVVEWQYDPTNVGETPKYTFGQMGCSAPQLSFNTQYPFVISGPAGYSPVAGRAYCWTFYNPNTLQESSPSPFLNHVSIVESDNSNNVGFLNGAVTPILPANPQGSYREIELTLPLAALTPAIGQGYSCIRVYATQDGGTTFYLVNVLYDSASNRLSNDDGSVPIAHLIARQAIDSSTDYAVVPGRQAAVNCATLYDGNGQDNLVPDASLLQTAYWTFTLGTGMTHVYGGSPSGGNAISYAGTGSSAAANFCQSNAVTIQAGTYYFQGYIGNPGTGATVAWLVVDSLGNNLLSAVQSDTTNGIVHGTFSVASTTQIAFVAGITGTTVPSGNNVIWAEPQCNPGSGFVTITKAYPTPDQNLVQPAPAAFSNQPPPLALTSELFADALFLVDWNDQMKIWYSQQGNYEKYGINSWVRSSNHGYGGDFILQLVHSYDLLLVGRAREIEQIDTYPPTEPLCVDHQHGVNSRRGAVPYGTSILTLMSNGLGIARLTAAIQEDALETGVVSDTIADDIKPLIDTIDANELTINLTNKLPASVTWNVNDLYLLAYAAQSIAYNNYVLVRNLGRGQGFWRYTSLPNGQEIITLKEIRTASGGTGSWPLAGNGQTALIAFTADQKAWVMFGGTQNGTITATAVTQPLPVPSDLSPELWDTDKTFNEMYVEGDDLSNFEVSFSLDEGVTWDTPRPLTKRLRIGKRGKNLTIKFTHSAATSNVPLLSFLKILYNVLGVTAS